MVFVTEDWSGFEGYAEHCRVGTFQLKTVVDGVEVRVRAGRLGFIAVYDDEDDVVLRRILKFCRAEGFIRVEHTIDDEMFHL